MKGYLFLFITFFQIGRSYSQSHFIISGKTNILKDGRVVLLGNVSNSLYSLRVQADTVKISNYTFQFEGVIKYPEQHRIVILNTSYISEPFFVDEGFQEIRIDSANRPHDLLDFGFGVIVNGSKTNDEYFNKYLPRFSDVYKMFNLYFSEMNYCDTITDLETKKLCIVNSDSVRVKLKLIRDSLLLNYALLAPKSKIIPWLIRDALSYYGYNNLYQKAFEQVESYMPNKMKIYLDSVLTKEKSIAIGSPFPLVDFISSHFSEKYLQENKYTLVDFWFAKCRPCIGQFKLLKDVYQKHNKNGFDIVAISIDKQSDIQEYEKIVKQNEYKWNQILDTSGVQAEFIGVSKYPTNFLLDKSGNIIAIDIKPFVLEIFLEKNL